MEIRTFVSILTHVLAVLIITGSCATTSESLKKVVISGELLDVKRLIEKGADVNAKDNEGITALMYAVAFEHPEMVKLLIDAGADVNAKDNEGITALMVASFEGYTDIVELLIKAGAKENSFI
jgi:ankyrin repeat protein